MNEHKECLIPHLTVILMERNELQMVKLFGFVTKK